MDSLINSRELTCPSGEKTVKAVRLASAQVPITHSLRKEGTGRETYLDRTIWTWRQVIRIELDGRAKEVMYTLSRRLKYER